MLKYVYIFFGSLSLFLGILGFITPGLPVTPFILLTGILYAKGSPRLYKKLEDHKITGPYLKRINTGVSLKIKLLSIAFMWAMISFTIFVPFSDNKTMQLVMIGLGIIGTACQIIFLKKKKNDMRIVNEKETDTI